MTPELEVKRDESGARTLYWKTEAGTALIGFVGTDGRFRSVDDRTKGVDRAKWGVGLQDQIRNTLSRAGGAP